MSTDSKELKRIILVFVTSLIVSLSMLAIGNQIYKAVIKQRMISCVLASARESDGAENLVIMDGRSGNVGSSSIQLKYLDSGYISIIGKNIDDTGQWKQIAEFVLEPGTYTLTGLEGSSQTIVAIRLHLEDSEGAVANYWQYDEDIQFSITNTSKATLSIRVNQHAEVNAVARPAVYKDE
jgi:hypothetical protein